MENRTELEKQQAKIIEQQKTKILNLKIFIATFKNSYFDLNERTQALFYAIIDENFKEEEDKRNPSVAVLAELGAHYTELTYSEIKKEEEVLKETI